MTESTRADKEIGMKMFSFKVCNFSQTLYFSLEHQQMNLFSVALSKLAISGEDAFETSEVKTFSEPLRSITKHMEKEKEEKSTKNCKTKFTRKNVQFCSLNKRK